MLFTLLVQSNQNNKMQTIKTTNKNTYTRKKGYTIDVTKECNGRSLVLLELYSQLESQTETFHQLYIEVEFSCYSVIPQEVILA